MLFRFIPRRFDGTGATIRHHLRLLRPLRTMCLSRVPASPATDRRTLPAVTPPLYLRTASPVKLLADRRKPTRLARCQDLLHQPLVVMQVMHGSQERAEDF